jgi:hypothetical protein
MAQIIDLGKLRFYWAGEYNSATVYEVNDVVKYGGNVYVYTNTLSVAGNTPTDTDYWALMISGLKFEGDYASGTSYQVGDGVAYGGIVYIAVADTTGNPPPNATYWSQFADGIQYEGSYSNGTAYQLNDVVTYGGKAYIATALTSGNVPTNPSYWDILTEGVRGRGNYGNSTAYLPGDIVSYGGNVYLNILTSTGNIPTNVTYWSLMASGIKYIGAYDNAVAYKINELVKYGPKMYVAKQATTGNLPTNATYWEALVDGIGASGVYNNGTAYVPGSVVAYGANLYICTAETTGNLPTDTAKWDLFIPSIASVGSYSDADTYYVGDIVRYGANLYICKLESEDNLPTNTTYFDLFIASIVSAGTYNSGTAYRIGDIVKYGSNLYVCKLDSTGNLPTNTTYFDTFINSLQNAGTWASGDTYYLGDIVKYGANRYVALRETVGDAPDLSASDWEILTEGLDIRGSWDDTTQYYINDVVTRGGSTYICILKHSSSASFATDLAASKWTKYNSGIRWRGEWAPSTAYLTDDLVYNGVSTYIAVADFTSDADDFLEDTDWELLSLGADTLPNQVGNDGKFLSTNGTIAVWASSGTLDSLTVNEDLEVNGDVIQHGNIDITSRSMNVSNVIKTNNVATLTTSDDHYFDAGDTVTVTGIDTYPDDNFDGTFTISTVPTPTTFTYTKAGANVGSTAVSGATANVVGELTVGGISHFIGDVNLDGTLTVAQTTYIGANAATFEADATLTEAAAVVQITGDPASYAQIAFRNQEPTSSTDFIAYADNGNDGAGWIDMGITGSEFEQAEFGITSKNDGYIFLQAPDQLVASVSNKALTNNVATLTTSAAHGFISGFQVLVAGVDATFNGTYTITGTTSNTFTYAKTNANVASAVSSGGTATSATGDGNLVIATGGNGYKGKIIFGAGGFDSGVTQMEIDPGNGMHITINTASTSSTTGALVVDGGAGIGEALHVAGDLHAESSVDFTNAEKIIFGVDSSTFHDSLTNPTLTITADNPDYTQVAFQNQSAANAASTDFIAYADNGDDDAGYIDMGITSSTFDDPTFTITGPNDGYIFMVAPDGTTGNGDLVIATGDTGERNAIVFAAGGLASDTTQMTIVPDVAVHVEIDTPSTNSSTGALTVVGGVGVTGDMNIQGNVAIQGTITFGGGGTTVSAANLSVTDPFVFVGNANQSDIIDLGFIAEHTVPVSAIVNTVTTKALTNNVATLTTGTDHTYRVGDVVVVTDVDATFNGTYSIIAVPTTVTFTYAKTAANVTSTAVSPNGATSVSARRVYAGMARDASDGVIKVFDNAVTKPATTINFSEAGLTYSDLRIKNLDAAAIVGTGNLTIATDKLTVTASTGAVSIANTLGVTGILTATGGIEAPGAINAQGTLTVAGTTTLNGGINVVGNMDVTGRFTAQEIREYVLDRTVGAVTSNVATLDYSLGNIYYINTAPSANFAIDLINVPTDNGFSLSITVVVTQGATGYIPNSFRVGGVSLTSGLNSNGIKWTGAALPTPTSSAGKLDVFSFTLIRRGSAWEVLGSAVLNF